ncbi:putative N-acetyltransferase YjcF [Corynebacterium glaucum]|uniref:Putative N-acetyltransferase YjcF n=1 Tax=Corynebacterium glaucum TaxID=187491 RepID=A0A1Q2HUT7_9CORY|nr:putative N-acetyltransferase YjcF [Corynebacterium glaucum]WJZ07143.1 putative acyltransferase [Corynebacterium glaucum]
MALHFDNTCHSNNNETIRDVGATLHCVTHLEFKRLDEMTSREAYDLFKLRVDVFVAEQQCPFAEIDETDAAPDTSHILAYDADGRLAGCARVFPTADTEMTETPGSRFGRFIVAPFARGTGLGPRIVEAGIKFTERWPGDLVIEAQAGLVPYYNQFGFVEEGDEFLDTGIPHRVMRIRR